MTMKNTVLVLSFFLFLNAQTLAKIIKRESQSSTPTKKDGLAVPLPAIILLSALGVCLIVFAILYKFISFDTCCQGTKDGDKSKIIDKVQYTEVGQIDIHSDIEEGKDKRRRSNFKSVIASNPVLDDTDFNAGRGRPKAKSVTSLNKPQINLPRRTSAAPPPRRSDKLSLAAIEHSSRVRSESDLSLSSTASSQYNYGSWGDSLGKPGLPMKHISPLALSAAGGRRAAGQRAMSAYGDIISLRPENRSKNLLGKLQVSVSYAPTAQRLEIEIIRIEEINQAVFQMGLASYMETHITLLPSKRARYKTKAKAVNNVSFQERWVVKNVSKQELESMKMRFRVYSHEFIGKGKLLGENTSDVMLFDLEDIGSTQWLNLSPSKEITKLICS
ncbi:uncharacterized protein LOC116288365 [Actinia tenebrosa]|uniref:Uncharacterized protein LOC116288365 n=1 Tax=Actinia tenebrosa TaxID=6105 RepID=A0A6P8HEE3_ACTTE|nr:uncharacterized protein LOC116288365 [Actinia tenebrosa]